jgi:excisionase family DNA binding protein
MPKSLSMKTMRSSPAKTAAHPFADKQKITKEVRRVNTTTISQRDAYKLMLKEYPDVMNIEQMCEILGISTKTGYRILREGKVCCIKVGRAYRIPKAHLFTYLSIGCAELQEAANA